MVTKRKSSLPVKGKKFKYSEDDFIRYGLNFCDYMGNPFYYMDGNQVVQNPKFLGLGSGVLKEFEKEMSKK